MFDLVFLFSVNNNPKAKVFHRHILFFMYIEKTFHGTLISIVHKDHLLKAHIQAKIYNHLRYKMLQKCDKKN